jgi:hypothetical protein
LNLKLNLNGRVFEGNFSGVGAESTSECTFIKADRTFSEGRTGLNSKQSCTGIVRNLGEK